MFAAAAATSVLSLYGSAAFADTQADGVAQNSAGVLSGNTVQAPIEVPVNVCGNTVDAAAALNPAFGNRCGNVSDGTTSTVTTPPTTPVTAPPTTPTSTTPTSTTPTSTTPTTSTTPRTSAVTDSSCDDQGGSGDEDGYGNEDGYGDQPSGDCPTSPPTEHTPPAHHSTPPQMAETGSGNTGAMIATSAASAALIAGGAFLYRRSRTIGFNR